MVDAVAVCSSRVLQLVGSTFTLQRGEDDKHTKDEDSYQDCDEQVVPSHPPRPDLEVLPDDVGWLWSVRDLRNRLAEKLEWLAFLVSSSVLAMEQ